MLMFQGAVAVIVFIPFRRRGADTPQGNAARPLWVRRRADAGDGRALSGLVTMLVQVTVNNWSNRQGQS